MKKILGEIQDGTFANNWIAEYKAGLPKYNEYKKADEDHLSRPPARSSAS